MPATKEAVQKVVDAAVKLPIELLPGTHPKQFRWKKLGQQCQGALPTSVEDAVAALIGIAKRALYDAAEARAELKELRDAVTPVPHVERSETEPTAKPVSTSTGKRKG